MAYFDNAATSYPKPVEVYTAMDNFYRNCGGSAGRGKYNLAAHAKILVDETRDLLVEMLHAQGKKVIFTPTATIALNMIIQGIIEGGARNIYISPFEHNAVTRTLFHFEKVGKIQVKELAVTNFFEYDLPRIKFQFDAVRSDFVIVNHA